MKCNDSYNAGYLFHGIVCEHLTSFENAVFFNLLHFQVFDFHDQIPS